MRTGKTKTRFLLIGIVVAVTAYLYGSWGGLQHDYSDAKTSKAYSYEISKK
ncbi:hypothetical protein [Pontibacter akesuensis]|uniref:Uncharacterized protein n=1 Tax=Pontibacter akesuensis TaxID=388950 RepID=A0A1I7J1K4_9BACT|nr:hypothetical protein [Pontibacter akesuensis]GHA73041.1 hypothetical protein GCM10007389_28650 [Pontibacter akesuensis]SFU78961.1 hypothetical protein SAMN04487941_2397 [Pontibacter akesuensis]